MKWTEKQDNFVIQKIKDEQPVPIEELVKMTGLSVFSVRKYVRKVANKMGIRLTGYTSGFPMAIGLNKKLLINNSVKIKKKFKCTCTMSDSEDKIHLSILAVEEEEAIREIKKRYPGISEITSICEVYNK